MRKRRHPGLISEPAGRWPGWFDNKRQLVDLPPDISIAEAGNRSDNTIAPTVDRTRIGGSLEALVDWHGTGSSNPSSSCGESAVSLTEPLGSRPIQTV
jgi:hypothetical protein